MRSVCDNHSISLNLFFNTGEAQTNPLTISGKFYNYDVIAEDGVDGVATLTLNSSINDQGTVAFQTSNAGERNSPVYLRKITGQKYLAGSSLPPGSYYEGSYIQVNNNNQVTVIGSSHQNGYAVWRLDGNNPGPPTPIVTNGSDGGVFIPHGVTGINNLNQPIFTGAMFGDGDGSTRIMSGTTSNFPNGISYTPPFSQTVCCFLFPMIADTGKIIARAGTTPTSPLRLYDYNLASYMDLATTGPGQFAQIGAAPGISDDGKVVVFRGVLNSTLGDYNSNHNTTSGPGVFAVVDIGLPTQRIIRLANRPIENVGAITGNVPGNTGKGDGVCDPGEMCFPGELSREGGTPRFLTMNPFDLDTRVGVIHQDGGTEGLEGDTIVAAFIATPNESGPPPELFTNNKGLWTVTVKFKKEGSSVFEKPGRPVPVIQELDHIGSRTINGIYIYDPIARAATGDGRTERPGDHRLAFYAATDVGGIIVRATMTDNDEDGLPDHWETSGIDFDGNGAVDLALHQAPYSANPNHKDLFVEIDYMHVRTAKHTHRPNASALDDVKGAFAAAPVQNPDNVNGITLHPMVSESMPEVTAPRFLSRGPGARDDFTDIKLGSSGLACNNGPNGARLGNSADRASVNCPNILGAKFISFRYTIIGHQFWYQGSPRTNLGIAELGGDDFFVPDGVTSNNTYKTMGGISPSCRPGETAIVCGRRERQSGVFMHEMGHTLNLRHGGIDNFNCKPNYFSVMSYSRYIRWSSFLTPWVLDYSRTALNELDESSLNEPAGVGGTAGWYTAYGSSVGGYYDSNIGQWTFYRGNAQGPVDWNFNGVATDTGVNEDVNYIKAFDCRRDDDNDGNPGGRTRLQGAEDWSKLRFSSRDSRFFGDDSLASTEAPEELMSETIETFWASNDGDGDGVPDLSDSCPRLPNSTQVDSDADGFGDDCDTISSDLAITVSSSPSVVRINHPITFTITVMNNGPVETARSIVVDYELPPMLQATSGTSTMASCDVDIDGLGVSCNADSLAVNNSFVITITATPITAGSIASTVTVENGIGDLARTNNTATITNTSINSAIPRFDLNGDGITDLVVWRPDTSTWYVIQLTDYTIIQDPFGEPGDKPVPADYDGDGITDFAVFRPSTSVWYVLYSASSSFAGYTWGIPGDKPAPGDYDGDGKADFTVFRPSEGVWYTLTSSTSNIIAVPFGIDGDKTVQGDYNGDGITDRAVFRPSEGVWYVSIQGQNYTARQFGQSSDKLVPADYDGDGKTDLGVWRPSDRNWYTAPFSEPDPQNNHTAIEWGRNRGHSPTSRL